VLVKKFNIAPVTTAQEDLKERLWATEKRMYASCQTRRDPEVL